MGVNVDSDFLSLAEGFLHCRIGSIPFIYLGLPVGANMRKERTWEPLIQHISNRLGSWRNRFVSLGGRVVRIDLILNSIPIFYLSFIKSPSSVWKRIMRIQTFGWGVGGSMVLRKSLRSIG